MPRSLVQSGGTLDSLGSPAFHSDIRFDDDQRTRRAESWIAALSSGKAHDWQCRCPALNSVPTNEFAHRRFDLTSSSSSDARRSLTTFFKRCLVVDPIAIRTDFANEEPRTLPTRPRQLSMVVVSTSGSPMCKPQFGQVRDLVHLTAGRLEQDARAHSVGGCRAGDPVEIRRPEPSHAPVGPARSANDSRCQAAISPNCPSTTARKSDTSNGADPKRDKGLCARLLELLALAAQEIHCASMASAPRVC